MAAQPRCTSAGRSRSTSRWCPSPRPSPRPGPPSPPSLCRPPPPPSLPRPPAPIWPSCIPMSADVAIHHSYNARVTTIKILNIHPSSDLSRILRGLWRGRGQVPVLGVAPRPQHRHHRAGPQAAQARGDVLPGPSRRLHPVHAVRLLPAGCVLHLQPLQVLPHPGRPGRRRHTHTETTLQVENVILARSLSFNL